MDTAGRKSNKIMSVLERINRPTPDKWRKVGKAIHLLGTMLQVALAGTGMSNVAIVISIAIVQWVGATVTDFATEEPKQLPDETN